MPSGKVRIRLIQLGYPSVDLRKVLHWKSKLFEVVGIQHKADLPNSDGDSWTLSKKRLAKVIGKNEGADLTFAVTDRPIEDNYYMHRLTDQTCVLSFYQVSGILAASNLQPEMFVLRNIYEMVSVWQEMGGKLGANAYDLHHEDTRGCLYDFNADKGEVVRSTERVRLCPSCKGRLTAASVPLGFVDGLEKEIRRIKKPWSYRLFDFVKAHPFWSLAISVVASLTLNLVATVFYEVCVRGFLLAKGWVH
jgi:hypothetical protein